jgi:hypothetical protein
MVNTGFSHKWKDIIFSIITSGKFNIEIGG